MIISIILFSHFYFKSRGEKNVNANNINFYSSRNSILLKFENKKRNSFLNNNIKYKFNHTVN